ncbi:MAG: hypothetical protein KGI41_04170, partial [Patescibacteria group bacterium]|nr:hypothetical protein [Patescibacteria group bacterium]
MKSTRYLGLVLAVFVFTFGSAPLAHAVAAPCTSGVGSPLLFNLSEQITNDPDSSNAPSGGDWATDTITRNVQIWQDASNPTYYCAQADDTGTFTTFGGTRGISPQSGASLPEVVTGTIVGTVGPVATTTVPADAGAWGSTHAIDCQNSDSCSTIGAWMKNYFGSMFSSYDWTWTYDGGANETWTNAQPSSGDIVHVQPATVYVDPTTGDDANYGDAAHPFKTVPAAMAAVADNGKVELVATTTPYDSIAITRPITLTSASTTDKAQIDGTVTIGSDNVTV